MKIEIPQSGQPTASLCRVFTDFDNLAAFFTGWQGRFEQISAGKFAGQLQLVEGRLIKLVAVEFNQVVLARGYRETGLFSVYPVTSRNAGGIWHGRTLSQGRFVLHGTEAETNHLSSRHCQTIGITVQADVIQRVADVLFNGDASMLPASWDNMQPASMHFQKYLAQIQTLMQIGLSHPALISTEEWNQREQECLRILLNSLIADAAQHRKLPPHRRTVIVRSAEELMRSSLHQPLGVVDLCGRLGISDRTMRLAFLEQYGVGPMTFFRTLRLNAVRSALKANPLHSIMRTANDFGFHHLGHFSTGYRRLFGEVPSAIRRNGHYRTKKTGNGIVPRLFP